MNSARREIKIKCTRMLSYISKFSALCLLIRLDISMMYSLMFPFPICRIETNLVRIVVVSTFSLAVNQSIICLRKDLTSSYSRIKPLMDSRMDNFMIIRLMELNCSYFSNATLYSLVLSLVRNSGRSSLNAWSKSM